MDPDPQFKKTPLSLALADAAAPQQPSVLLGVPTPVAITPEESADSISEARYRTFLVAYLDAVDTLFQDYLCANGFNPCNFDVDFKKEGDAITFVFSTLLVDKHGETLVGRVDTHTDKAFKGFLAQVLDASRDAIARSELERGMYVVMSKSPWTIVELLRGYMERAELCCIDDLEDKAVSTTKTHRYGSLPYETMTAMAMRPYLSSASAAMTAEAEAGTDVMPFSLKYLEALIVAAQTPAHTPTHYPDALRAYRCH